MPKLNYTPVTRDLAHKCGNDVSAALRQTMTLGADPQEKLMIALFAAGMVVATLAGAIRGVYECSEQEAEKTAADLLATFSTAEGRAEVLAKAKS